MKRKHLCPRDWSTVGVVGNAVGGGWLVLLGGQLRVGKAKMKIPAKNIKYLIGKIRVSGIFSNGKLLCPKSFRIRAERCFSTKLIL